MLFFTTRKVIYEARSLKLLCWFPGTDVTKDNQLGSTTEMYRLTVLEVSNLKSRCGQDRAPSESANEGSVPSPSPHFW